MVDGVRKESSNSVAVGKGGRGLLIVNTLAIDIENKCIPTDTNYCL
jgi:hypothetical protein